MDSMKRLVMLGVGMAVVGVVAGTGPASAQTKEARGTITAITDTTLSVKAGAREVTFYVDGQTLLDVRSEARRIQQAQPGNPSPRVNDFFEAGQTVLVRFREENGRNHALDIDRVGSAGAGGGSISDTRGIAEGKVLKVSDSELTVQDGARDYMFRVTRDTDVLARGSSKATRAAGGTTTLGTFVHAGDIVSVSFTEAGGVVTATQIRVRVPNR